MKKKNRTEVSFSVPSGWRGSCQRASRLPLALLACLALAPPAGAANLQAAYRVFLDSTNNSEEQQTVDWCGAGGTCGVVGGLPQASVLYDQQNQYASAVATAGVMRIRTTADWPGFTFTPFFSTAETSISDVFTLTAADGSPNTVARLRFYINGSLDYTTNGQASMFTRIRLVGDNLFNSYRFQASNSAAGLVTEVFDWGLLGPEESLLGDPFGQFELYVQLPIGTPIQLDWILGSTASPVPANLDELPGTASARLDQTAGWLGIDFLDFNLEPLEGIQLTSEAGYDWSTATVVPLPAAGWLLLSGLGLLGFCRARQRAVASPASRTLQATGPALATVCALGTALGALAGLILLAQPATAAQLQVVGNAFVNYEATSDIDGESFDKSSTDVSVGELNGRARGELVTDGVKVTSLARADAGYGWLRLRSNLDLGAPPVFSRHTGAANLGASFRDEITIMPQDPSLMSTVGIMTVELLLSGSAKAAVSPVDLSGLSPTAPVSNLGTSWRVDVTLGNCLLTDACQVPVSENQSVNGRGPQVATASLGETLQVHLAVLFGNPANLTVGMTSSIAGIALANRGNLTGEVNLSETLVWGGITGIVDSNGAPVEYSLLSESGIDWSQAVTPPAVIPLPASVWLLLSALGVLRLLGSGK